MGTRPGERLDRREDVLQGEGHIFSRRVVLNLHRETTRIPFDVSVCAESCLQGQLRRLRFLEMIELRMRSVSNTLRATTVDDRLLVLCAQRFPSPCVFAFYTQQVDLAFCDYLRGGALWGCELRFLDGKILLAEKGVNGFRWDMGESWRGSQFRLVITYNFFYLFCSCTRTAEFIHGERTVL